MSSLESKVVTWIQEEFPFSNLKIGAKDVTRLITSKNGHLYIKLLSLLSENFKSKSKFKAIKDSSSLISEKKKRDALKNDLIKVEKGLGGLLSAVHQEEKRLEQERRKTDMMKTKETLFKSLSSALEMIKLFCESFSKAQIPQVDVDSLFKEQLSIKDLFPNGSVTVFQTRQRRKEINYNTTLDEINKMIANINTILTELSNQRLEVPKISFDQTFLKNLLDHDCHKSNNSLDVIGTISVRTDHSKSSNHRFNFGLSALKLVNDYEEHRSAQETKLLDKLEQAYSRMQRLVERLPSVKAS
ncbi:uncharacterized protein LOC128386176 [Panonychus citri]|uniref:uncharacterized protein LOC128386176 n=1 Tax=Panonychus citri TaxID=50023 RepID=UPI00230800E7|nr:uncharacterized protein LOC128386176 [Panonychus citri]